MFLSLLQACKDIDTPLVIIGQDPIWNKNTVMP
jgi:hypothetical protein